ncbi:hypothetical protein CkaCkLH20_12053 [Colletotrichum karsti]|uniref:VOC domain-containing protein n=1 Tax=Colletotrichum karsti TaxID=1095194 RepID=A0A9P6HWR5_9PEZI|nr:uncharacterized protein CkaCkLH20_12053 [Colletotrichum karsti]KAF9870386.1 hypothetical protein CkaCkLH20_12053 [Colletotrichum karsti]
MIPYFDVSHLPSSASFYSAVLQPLGLHYISTDTLTAADDSSKSIITTSPKCELARLPVAVNYGIRTSTSRSPPTPVFQIREARNSSEPLKKSRVVFSAPSPTTVTDFHSFTLRANPALLLTLLPVFHSQTPSRPAALTQSGDTHRAIVTDLDGNTMEVVYQPPPNYPPSYAGSTFRKTQSTQKEVSRILDWNYDVAAASSSTSSSSSSSPPPRSVSRSVAGSSAPSRKMSSQAGGGGGAFPGDQPYTILRRSVTTSVIESPSANKDLIADPAHSAAPSSALQTGTVVGSLLGAAVGAAAGAAITYSMLRKERAQAPRQEFDGDVDGHGHGPAPPFQRRATFPEQYPDQHPAPRYVEVERTVEKIRYPEAYPALPDSRSHPQHMAKHSQVGARSRAVDDLEDDGRSQASSRYQLERGASVRSRSQAPASRAPPLMLTDYEHQSNAGSRFTVAKSAVPRTIVDDAGTYVSARSQSTVRPPPPTVETILGARSIAPSRAPTHALSMAPSRAPTKAPSRAPTAAPSRAPTAAPSRAPTVAQSRAPTAAPSRAPTKAPTKAPTMVPARAPTVVRAAQQQPHYAYPPATRAPTYMPAAHNNPVPRSGAGSSHARWDDDAVSVAPSDSISCIGSRTSRRQYH